MSPTAPGRLASRWLPWVLVTGLLASCGQASDGVALAETAPAAEPIPTSTEPLNEALVNLPEQQWVRIQPLPSTRYVPRNYQDSDAAEPDPNPQGRDYSGVVYADGRLVYFGGGHAGYMGNDVEVYDIRRNVWTQSYRPDVAPERSSDGTWITRLAPMGRPWVEHTYQTGCYDPTSQSVVWLLQYAGTMRFDLRTGAWTPMAGPHAGGSRGDALVGQAWGSRACFGWDPELRTYLAADTATFSGVYAWRRGSWSYYTDMPPSNWRTPYSAYMADRREYLVWNGFAWWVFSPRNKRWTPGPPVNDPHVDSFDYDTRNRVIVGAHYGEGPLSMWLLKPDEKVWTKIPATMPAPRPPVGGTAAAALLRYDPAHNVFFLVVFRPGSGGTSRPIELWAWRYKSAATQP